jgi:hypothetical protein
MDMEGQQDANTIVVESQIFTNVIPLIGKVPMGKFVIKMLNANIYSFLYTKFKEL